MKNNINRFLAALKSILEKKNPEKLSKDLLNPEEFAETISHSIGSSTQKISFSKLPTHEE